MPGHHDGLPLLPDLTSIDHIETELIPALEDWVRLAKRGTDEWAARVTVLVTVHNRLLGLRLAGRVTALEADLEARFDALEALILSETTRGIGSVTAHIDGGHS